MPFPTAFTKPAQQRTWPDWLSNFNISIKDYEFPCVMCCECLDYLADQYTDGMHEVLAIMEKHWTEKHA